MGGLELVQSLSGHQGRAWNVSWHPQGRLLASCGEDKTVRVWGGGAGGRWAAKTVLADGHQRTIRGVAWSPCGGRLASASFDATVAVWDRKSGEFECAASLEGHENEVKSVAWSASGRLLATCSRDKSVWVWEVADDDDEFECAAVLNAHTQDVKKVAWHPREDLLASAGYDNTVRIFREDVADSDWSCVATLESHDSTVWSLAFDRSGSRLATASDDRTVKIWQEYPPGNPEGVATPGGESAWKCVCTLGGYHQRTVYDVAWCHLTDLLATACGDDAIRVFKEAPDSDPNQPTFALVTTRDRAHMQDVNAIQWSPTDPGLLASASDDGEVKLWRFSE